MIYWCPKYGIVWTTVNTGKRVNLKYGKDQDRFKVVNLPRKECP